MKRLATDPPRVCTCLPTCLRDVVHNKQCSACVRGSLDCPAERLAVDSNSRQSAQQPEPPACKRVGVAFCLPRGAVAVVSNNLHQASATCLLACKGSVLFNFVCPAERWQLTTRACSQHAPLLLPRLPLLLLHWCQHESVSQRCGNMMVSTWCRHGVNAVMASTFGVNVASTWRQQRRRTARAWPRLAPPPLLPGSCPASLPGAARRRRVQAR